ncbi:MAG TPA: hypothetical protein VIL74_02465 [Pyrinomonadaceae bacterium]|jgi:hypothetical protein
MKSNVFLIVIFLACFISVSAQQAQPSPATAGGLQQRITQMETEMKRLAEELANLKNALAANDPATESTAIGSTITGIESKTETKTETKPEKKADRNGEAAKQTKSTGVELGSTRLIPYGTIYFNAFSNGAGTNNADVPLFAAPTGNGNTSASVRQSRLGFRLEGLKIGDANLKAVLEADFFGGFPSVGIGENFGVVRLRLANARLDWEKHH